MKKMQSTFVILALMSPIFLYGQDTIQGPVVIPLMNQMGFGLNVGENNTITNSDFSLTFGKQLETSAWGSVNFGYLGKITGQMSMVVGYDSEATGFTSYAFGTYNKALNDYSQAFGKNCIASGQVSTAIGEGTRSQAQFSTAVGRWNVGGCNTGSWIETDPLFEIGNGNGDQARSNALTILKNGKATFHNNVNVSNTFAVGDTEVPPGHIAVFKGSIVVEGVTVKLHENWEFPDYVFEPDYHLRSLRDVRAYIDMHGHLPEVPSAKEVEKKGIMLEEMNLMLLKKVEELTLYILKQEERINQVESVLQVENHVSTKK